MRIVLTASAAFYLGVALWLFSLMIQFPVPAAPAVIGALAGLVRYRRRRGADRWLKDFIDKDQLALSDVLTCSIALGSIGFAVLALLGIGLPQPDVSAGWRVFGGIALGATAGLAAGMGIWLLVGFISMVLAFRTLPRAQA